MAAVANKRSVMMLYSDVMCPHSHTVRFVLAEKSVNVEIHDVDPDNMSEDLMDLNPYGTLPTLVDRDLVIYNARVIMEYLDERFPHPPLLPVDPVSRARSRLMIHRVDQDWYSLVNDIVTGGEKKAAKARKLLTESITTTAPIFEAMPYFMSEEFSLVDCVVAPLLWRLPLYKVNLPAEAQPVLDYAQRLFDRESFQTSLTEAEREIHLGA